MECGAWGWTGDTDVYCTLEAGHPGDHEDAHEAWQWKRRGLRPSGATGRTSHRAVTGSSDGSETK